MRKKFYRTIVFSKTPLKTHFQFRDIFQIYPCNLKNAPQSKYGKDFPLIIEFWIDENEKVTVSDKWGDIKDFISSTSVFANRLNQLLRILTVITNHRFFNYSDTEGGWSVILPEDEITEEINSQSSKWGMRLYYYPEMKNDIHIEKFTDQVHIDSKFYPHQFYYMHDPFDSPTKEISFPITIIRTLSKYFALQTESKKIANTVSHLICNGIDLRFQMKSLSFLSFVSSIETLVNYNYRNENDNIEFECHACQTIKSSSIKCEVCGRPIWGVSAKFRKFLRGYVASSPDSVKKFNRIYSLRSAIVHKGALLLGDEQIDWSESGKKESQWMTHIEAMQVARLALVNWLLMNPNH